MNDTSKHLVLVVDDAPYVRESTAVLLTTVGYDVITADNGFDALLQMKRATPDVIISDLNMPKMSGFELLSVVRRRFPEILRCLGCIPLLKCSQPRKIAPSTVKRARRRWHAAR